MGSAIENLLLGVIASTLVWVVFSRAIQPWLTVSKEISKTLSLVHKTDTFKLKIENKGLFEVYDIQLAGRFRVYGLSENRPEKPIIYIARIGEGGHPNIEGWLGNRKLDVTGREFLIRPTKEAKKQLGELWNISERSINVERILERDTHNSLDVSVVACHRFSGVRRCFKRRYYLKDIHPQYFFDKGVCLRNNIEVQKAESKNKTSRNTAFPEE